MKHALVAFALLAVPFAHADKAERKPSSSAQFADGSKVEATWVSGSSAVVQIRDSSGRKCYGFVANGEAGGSSITCF